MVPVANHPVKQPGWIDTAPITVSESIEIAASPEEVWAHIADHESWPEWFGPIERVEPLGAPTGVGGGRRIFVAKRPIDETFTAWDENEHFAFAVIASKLPVLHALAESVRLEPTATGTRVTYRQGLEGRRGFGWLMSLIWKRPAQQLAVAVKALKARVEATP